MCTNLWKVDKDEPCERPSSECLAGSLVSSLHRLKDIDNKDGGFFVFGDISVKVQGTYRLNFSLFDMQKDSGEVQFLGNIVSEPFKVLLQKDFKGMDESTYLSRAFSDQGVRLRLRKEPRAMMSNKRPYPYTVDSTTTNAPIRPMGEYFDDNSSQSKRYRTDPEDRKDHYTDHNVVSTASFPTSYAQSHYPVRQPTMSANYPMSQYPSFGSLTTGSTTPYSFRPNINTSSYYPEPVLQTTGAGGISSTLTTPRFPDMQFSSQHMYTPYNQQRGGSSSALSYSDDTAGLGTYRTSPVGLGDEHRPTTATGLVGMPMSQHTPQSQHSAHQSHDSIGSSRGASYSHSPEVVRPAGYQDRLQLGAQLPSPHRSAVRYDDSAQMPQSVYPNQSSRNHFQAPSAESSLTSHTDIGVIPPSLHSNQDSSQYTDI